MSAVTQKKSLEIIDRIATDLDQITLAGDGSDYPAPFFRFEFHRKTFLIGRKPTTPLFSSLGTQYYLRLLKGTDEYHIYPYRELALENMLPLSKDSEAEEKLAKIFRHLAGLYDKEVDRALGDDFFRS